ncbi:MAG: bifunctional phosphoribosylaminoimidazolecarboxamide formyltransferase/IMP cyclohydrolase [Anaerolineae bacterium]|nr:bifunctional phosphoribosylaminoimidazolecarboxamide formyltransferase/IMP cyclohydrolase [Candidatus Roseilinea sp.]MDW8450780.1 bifunctional phosphoribosylaminoimidazolecarboxamide formyltransferase/IMP cyclohydrolase [Anaerolineae bacterium]
MRALLSVSDKTRLIEFARGLHQHNVELIASGGTARALQHAGLPITTVEQLTGSPEILEGRVKTLHPIIHGGILARDTDEDRADLERIGAHMIDLVVVNLYPFQKTVAQKFVTLRDAIEHIDIGGVALIRAAAKNYERVTVVCDPCDYDLVLNDIARNGSVSLETREVLALKAFAHTAAYDAAIRDYLMGIQSHDSPILTLTLHKVQDLRYGENPHQQATLFSVNNNGCIGPLGGRLLQGKELSYNNLLDLDAAWRAAVHFEQPTIAIVKHLSPCGIACADELHKAYTAAFNADPVSAFGGVIASNWEVDAATVEAMGDLFIECIVAPGFTDEAKTMLGHRKNCRLLEIEDPAATTAPAYEYRSITGGLLRQTVDRGDPASARWRVVTQAQPSDDDMRVLQFAWKACQHVRSNAIVIARESRGVLATVGIGGGQPNRVDCVKIAAKRAGRKAKNAVLASDAFFPFPDGIHEAAKAGVKAIVQPGGAMRDAEVIAAADEAGIAMVFTGVRHFRH